MSFVCQGMLFSRMLRTERLQLRPWRDQDLPAFAALNADPRVMEFFLNPLDRAESDAMVQRISENFTRHGFGIWAVEAFGVAEFIGATGLSVPRYETPFTPCVEIPGGWLMNIGDSVMRLRLRV